MKRTPRRGAWWIALAAALTWTGCSAKPREVVAEDCGNGVDDDGNGAVDCQDSACAGQVSCMPEICDNNLDDDGDGRFDCADSGCASMPVCGGGSKCGNHAVDPGEDCDGADLGGRTCITQGFKAGALSCSASCAISTTSCSNVVLESCNNDVDDDVDGKIDCADSDRLQSFVCLCGNGVLNDSEECDGAPPPDTNCIIFGFGGGVLACDHCSFDFSACTPLICGDGVMSGDETCDDGNTVSGDGCDSSCQVELGPVCESIVPTVLVPGTNQGDTSGGTGGFEGSCTGFGGKAKIFKYTPASTGNVTIVLHGEFGLGLHVRTSCADPFSELACATAATSTTNPVVNVEVSAGVPITVFVVDHTGLPPEAVSPFTLMLVQTP